jgi:CTP:molybdopterin cytidylyltransferase MocA
MLTHWVISLGDQPHIEMSTLRLLLDAARKNPTRMREAFRLRVPVEDAGVCEDLDTADDYARWKPHGSLV